MSEFSYNDVLKLIPEARPRKFPEPQRDPVLEHCIKLRKFHNEVERLMLLTTNLKEVYDDSEREPILKTLPPVPELPELVKKSSDNKQESLAVEEIELSEESVVKLVSKSIAYVLFILGYTDMSSHLLQMLSKVVIDYVKSLTEMMVKLSPEDGSISLNLLETALQEKGINGIGELYSFYTQRIVKFHDSLYLKCKRSCDDLKNNLKKPDAPPKENITASSIDEQSSADQGDQSVKEKQNNEASTEDSTRYSLDTGGLAEDLFVQKKLKQKSVRFAPQIANCEISNHKDLLQMKIAANEGKTPVKNAVYSESFSNLNNVFLENTVSLECKNFDSNLYSAVSKNSSKVSSNSFHHYNETFDDSKKIVSDEKFSKKNTIASELIKPSDQEANIVSDKEKATDKNEIESELIEESSEKDATIIFDEALYINGICTELIDDLLDQNTDIVPVKNGIDSELIEESSEQYTSIVSEEKKGLDINGISSEFIDRLLDQDTNIVPDEEKAPAKIAICSESVSNLESEFSENIVSFKCSKPISDFSGELRTVNKHSTKISSISVCYSNGKPLHNHKVKRKLVDLKNLDSLCDSSTGNRKKRPKLRKHKKVYENDTSMETMSPKMKDDLRNCEYSSSVTDFNIDSKVCKKESGTISEEYSFCNSDFPHNSTANNSSEIVNIMPDVSSSSENETEQIWVSL